MMTAISELSMIPIPESEPVAYRRRVYRRANGDLYVKLNDQFHVKVKFSASKEGRHMWVGRNSPAKELDPNEQVEVVQ